MGVVIEKCVKDPGGRTRNKGTDIARRAPWRALCYRREFIYTCIVHTTSYNTREGGDTY
jgi:hypothetical protein